MFQVYDIMNQYLLKIFESENYYIYEGLLIPQMRDKILECFDDEHRPTVDEWNQYLHSVLSKIKRIFIKPFTNSVSFDIIYKNGGDKYGE